MHLSEWQTAHGRNFIKTSRQKLHLPGAALYLHLVLDHTSCPFNFAGVGGLELATDSSLDEVSVSVSVSLSLLLELLEDSELESSESDV